MADGKDDKGPDQPRDGIKKILFSAGFGDGASAIAAQPDAQPFVMCVAAEFGRDDPALFGQPLSDAADFNTFFEKLEPEVTIRVDDRIAGGDCDLALRFTSINDFQPDRLAQQIPSVSAALEAHVLLHTRAKGGIDDSHLKEGLDALDLPPSLLDTLRGMTAGGSPPRPSPAAAPKVDRPAADAGGGGGDLDKLLSMVDDPAAPGGGGEADGAGTSSTAAGLRAFISEVVAGSGGAQDPRARNAARHIDGLIAEQLDLVLTHPEVAALEAAWRGLSFLVRRSDFRAGIRILPRPAGLADAGDDDSDWPETLFHPLPDKSDVPDVVVLASPIGNTEASVGVLGRLAAAGERHHTPVLCSLASDFTGLDPQRLPAMDDPGGQLTGPRFAGWNALRDRSSARWLVAGWNDPLARPAWQPREDRRLKLTGAGAVRDPGCRIPAAFAVAAMMAQSQARLGWPSEFVGRDGALDGLDMSEITVDAGEKVAIPFAYPVTSDAAHSLADAGILALACRYNRDTATLVAAPTVHRPGRFPDDPDGVAARRLSSLPYQTVVSRVVQALHHAPLDNAATAAEVARNALEPILGTSGPGAGLEVRLVPDPDEPGGDLLEIEARTGAVVGGGLTVFLDLPI